MGLRPIFTKKEITSTLRSITPRRGIEPLSTRRQRVRHPAASRGILTHGRPAASVVVHVVARRRIDPKIYARAYSLRVKRRLSDAAIARATGVAKSTIGIWLAAVPLSKHEQDTVRAVAKKAATQTLLKTLHRKSRGSPPRPSEPPISRLAAQQHWSGDRKMRVAEAAVLLRLATHGIGVYTSPFDGDSVDFIVETRSGMRRLSVRWASRRKRTSVAARAFMSLRTSDGRNKFRSMTAADTDLFAAFDPYEEAVYVWTAKELAGKRTAIAMNEDARERWDKLDL